VLSRKDLGEDATLPLRGFQQEEDLDSFPPPPPSLTDADTDPSSTPRGKLRRSVFDIWDRDSVEKGGGVGSGAVIPGSPQQTQKPGVTLAHSSSSNSFGGKGSLGIISEVTTQFLTSNMDMLSTRFHTM
jgi:hypothetical protein